jgi:hypothetical protein
VISDSGFAAGPLVDWGDYTLTSRAARA